MNIRDKEYSVQDKEGLGYKRVRSNTILNILESDKSNRKISK